MLRRILSGLKVRPDEQNQVLLLLIVGFCFGSFLVTFQISAEALFLNNIKHLLMEAILVSGGLGMITTGLFSFLQSRVSYARLIVGTLTIIFILTGLIYWMYFGASEEVRLYVIFAMFVMIGPFIAVILLSFWGVFGRLFNLRQSKRIIGWIDTGQLSAAILATLSFPLLADLIPETANYLLISAVSILLGVVFVIVIISKFDLSQAEVSGVKLGDEKTEKREGFRALLKDRYVLLLSSFLIFSMVTFTFIQFSFQNVAALQYPDESDLRNFLAQFHLGYLLLSFILQTFVNDKIIGVYGLKVALFILPIIVGLFMLSSILTGFFFGYDPATSPNTFIWFFLFISITRLFNYSLRDALENPTFKLFFMPLDNRTRFDVQTKVEGVVNETARFLAGGLIILLSLVTFFELIHYSIAVLILIVGYMYIIGKMYNQYRNKIKIKLETQQASSDTEESQRIIMSRSLEEYLKDVTPDKAVFLFKLLEKINPNAVGSSINKLMNHESEKVRGYAQDRINRLKGLSVSDKYVIQVGSGGTEDTSVKNMVDGLDLEGLLSTGNITKRRISRLCKSDNAEDRQYAAELLGNSSENENISFLIELLHDTDINVRLAAINAAEKNFDDEIINALTDSLAHPVISNNAMNSLVKIGGRALNTLDIAFYRTGQNTKTMIKILQIYGRIGGNKAIKQLWSKIDYPDKVLVSEALLSLGECGFKAGISQISRIKFAIESDIQDVAWNLAASTEVSEVGGGDLLKEALHEENDHDMEHIYMLMGMLYDARSIQLVKENMESGTTEGVTFAIELLDVFLSEDLKQKIIPLLDDISDAEKARKLEMFHPRARLDSKQVLKFLINRDYNQTNRWSKACAIYQIGHHKLEQYSLDIIANLFNPDPLVLEVSAWALYQIDEALYEEHTARVNKEEKRRLDSIIIKNRYDDGFKRLLRYDKVRFLKSMGLFSGIEGLVLAAMADNLRDVFLDKGEVMILPRGEREYFYIIYDGEAELNRVDRPKRDVKKGDFVGEFVQVEQDEASNSVVALTKTTLFRVRKDKFYELLSDNINVARQVINYF